MLQLQAPPKLDPPQNLAGMPRELPSAEPTPSTAPLICPHCHQARLIFIRRLTPGQAMGP
jgi:hypothetical protein